MVGVAGKSRACHDCKRRRVKCDYRRPSCMRCEKAGRSCLGYDRTAIFVNRTLTKPSTNALVAISEARLHYDRSVQNRPSKLHQAFEQLLSSTSDLSCTPVAFRSLAWKILKELYLPSLPPSDHTPITATSCYSWLSAVCQMKLESHVLDHSLLTFCAIQICIAEPRSVPLDLALHLYSQALSTLAQNLEYTHEQDKNETLAAIVVLSTCELFVFTNDQSWRAHAHGITELLCHRTSFDDTSVVWQRLCSRLRLICVIDALTKGKRLALGPDSWRQVMCVDDEECSFESLINIVSEVPILLEKSNDLIRSGEVDEEHLRNLFEVVRKIEAWKQCHKLAATKPPYWAVPSRLHNPSDNGFASPLFPFALEYRCLNVAMLFMFGSAVMLQMLTAALRIMDTSSVPRDVFFAQNNDPALGQPQLNEDESTNFQFRDEATLYSLPFIKRKADNIARFICQSIEYCCRQELGTVAAQASCHPQFTLRDYFQRAGLKRELEWCRNIKNMAGPGLRRGIDMMMFGSEQNIER